MSYSYEIVLIELALTWIGRSGKDGIKARICELAIEITSLRWLMTLDVSSKVGGRGGL